MLKLDGGFIQNLGRVYGLYTLGFLGFVVLMAILEAAGVSNTVIGWLFVAFCSNLCHDRDFVPYHGGSSQYYVAGREVPAVYNGMATVLTGCQVRHSSRWPGVFTSKVIHIWRFW